MREKKSGKKVKSSGKSLPSGFTLVELLVGSTILLVVILATLSFYRTSNKITVDQQQYTDLQHGVRTSMYFITRDVRLTGAGLPVEFYGYVMEGIDNETQGGAVDPDRLKLMGNLDDPLNMDVHNYQGAAANLTVDDWSFERNPYPDEFYDGMIVIILPNPDSGCRMGEIREITHVTHDEGGTNERFNFSPGLAPYINPPGGLSGTCPDSNDYDGGKLSFVNVKEYWLDVTGYYPGLNPGERGYIGNGEGGILYLNHNGIQHPLARNIENLQFQYNGDADNDGHLDGFMDWQPSWTGDTDLVGRIRQIRIWVLGRTPNPFVSIGADTPTNLYLYRRPDIANSPQSGQDDKHRRFLLESTASVRNLSLNIYNAGTR